MSRIPSKWTAPERRLHEALLDLGLTPECHCAELPGKPDFVFHDKRMVVQVEGCFWHGCPKHYKEPKTNKKFWRNKVRGNIRRDRATQAGLFTRGYSIVRVWECATRGERLAQTAQLIAELAAA